MRTRKTIKAELAAELDRERPDEGRVSELMAELRRARGGRDPDRHLLGGGRPRRRREGRIAELPIGPESGAQGTGPGEVDQDAEAIKTWPPELRAKIRRSPYARVIGDGPSGDPGGHGARNDARRWSPWR